MSSSNQRPANRGFRSVLRCAISHYRQSSCLSVPEPLHLSSYVKCCIDSLKSPPLSFINTPLSAQGIRSGKPA